MLLHYQDWEQDECFFSGWESVFSNTSVCVLTKAMQAVARFKMFCSRLNSNHKEFVLTCGLFRLKHEQCLKWCALHSDSGYSVLSTEDRLYASGPVITPLLNCMLQKCLCLLKCLFRSDTHTIFQEMSGQLFLVGRLAYFTFCSLVSLQSLSLSKMHLGLSVSCFLGLQ